MMKLYHGSTVNIDRINLPDAWQCGDGTVLSVAKISAVIYSIVKHL